MVEVINEPGYVTPGRAELIQGRSLTRPLVVLIAFLIATIALAFILENLRQSKTAAPTMGRGAAPEPSRSGPGWWSESRSRAAPSRPMDAPYRSLPRPALILPGAYAILAVAAALALDSGAVVAAVGAVGAVGFVIIAPRGVVSWRVLLGLMLLVILFVPIGRYRLPGALPFEIEPYRIAIALLVGLIIAALLVDGRVTIRKTAFEAPLMLVIFAAMGSVVANPGRVTPLGSEVLKSLTFLASFVVFFYIFVFVVRDRVTVDSLLSVLVAGAAVVAGLTVVESRTGFNPFNHLGFVPGLTLTSLPVVPDRGGLLRAYASGQHPIAMGAAFVLVIPIAIYLATRPQRPRDRTFWIASVLLLLVGALSHELEDGGRDADHDVPRVPVDAATGGAQVPARPLPRPARRAPGGARGDGLDSVGLLPEGGLRGPQQPDRQRAVAGAARRRRPNPRRSLAHAAARAGIRHECHPARRSQRVDPRRPVARHPPRDGHRGHRCVALALAARDRQVRPGGAGRPARPRLALRRLDGLGNLLRRQHVHVRHSGVHPGDLHALRGVGNRCGSHGDRPRDVGGVPPAAGRASGGGPGTMTLRDATRPDGRDEPDAPPERDFRRDAVPWLTDIVFGFVAGNILVIGLVQSMPLPDRVRTSGLVTLALVVLGGVLGIGFMRLIRTRE